MTGKEPPTESPAELLARYSSKSAAIRALADEGYSTNEIRIMLNLRYQHVRNVLTRPLKRGPNNGC